MATTHVDRHNDRLTREALESMRDHIQSSYLPFIFNHDPRCPPLGRTIDAEVVALADGEYALEAEVELFEPGPLPPLVDDRSIALRELPADSLLLTIDRTFSGPEFESEVRELSELFGRSPQFEAKKALDPIAVLIISAGALALGKFTSSFFSRLGENAADALSAKLKQIFSHRHNGEVRLLRLEFEFEHEGQRSRAEVILTDPTNEEIEQFLQEGLQRLDQLLPSYLDEIDGLVRYVFAYSKGDLTLQFALRRDAVPIFPHREGAA